MIYQVTKTLWAKIYKVENFTMLRSNLCDYSDKDIVVKWTIAVDGDNDAKNKK